MVSRTLFAINAGLLWFGVVLSTILSATDYYPPDLSSPSLYGNNAVGTGGMTGRLLDHFSYFTTLSNIVAALVVTILIFRPTSTSPVLRVLRLDSVIMMTVTGLIFNLLLNSGTHTGADWWSNSIQHVWGPIVTVAVWLIAGPHGWIRSSTIFAALILPLAWLVYALVRGSVTGAYPYNFLDVPVKGMASVLSFVAVLVVFAIVLGYIMMAVDAVMDRRYRRVGA